MTRAAITGALLALTALTLSGCGGEGAGVGSSASSAAASTKPAASGKPPAPASSPAPIPPPPSGPSEDDKITAADFEEDAEKEIDAGNAESELTALEKEITADK